MEIWVLFPNSIIQQMCNRVTNPLDMGIFSRLAFSGNLKATECIL